MLPGDVLQKNWKKKIEKNEENFIKLTWKLLSWSLFFNKVEDCRAETWLKIDSDMDVCYRIFQNLFTTAFLQNTVYVSCSKLISKYESNEVTQKACPGHLLQFKFFTGELIRWRLIRFVIFSKTKEYNYFLHVGLWSKQVTFPLNFLKM